MALSAEAQAYKGKTVEVRAGIGVGYPMVRRTEEGEQGVVEDVSDAGFNGLVFWVRLADGQHVNAYLSTSKVVN